jgi:hypothetical protein
LAFQFIPKVFDGVEVRALCRPVKFLHTDLNKPFLYGHRFVHGGDYAETGKGLPQTVATKLEAQNCLECHFNAVVIIFAWTGIKGLSPNHEKLYSCHNALGQVAFSWHPPNSDSSVGLPDAEAWYITPESAFSLL